MLYVALSHLEFQFGLFCAENSSLYYHHYIFSTSLSMVVLSTLKLFSDHYKFRVISCLFSGDLFSCKWVMFLSFFEIVNSMIYCRDYEFCHVPLKDIILREQLIWLSPYYKFSPATGTARISVQSL